MLVLPTAVAVSLVAAAPAGALGTSLFVSSTGTDTGDCSTTGTACATITYALTQAADGATINVSGTIEDNVTTSQNVTITGAGAASPAVIDGGGINAVLTLSGNVVLDHVTIQNGNSTTGGGGIYSTGDLTIISSTVTGNTAPGGAGLWINDGTVSIQSSTVSNNTATSDSLGGGGLFINGGNIVTVTNSTFSQNTAAGNGAGIFAAGDITMANDSISSNTADGGGGGLWIDSGTTLIHNTAVNDNNANGNDFGGGGAYVSGGNVTVLGSTFSGNSAFSNDGGGIESATDNTLHVTDSTFTGNGTSNDGGGIWAKSLTMTDSSVENNTATFGAGLWLESGSSSILASTFLNTGAENIYNNSDSLTLGGSILHRYDSAGGVDCNNQGATVTSSGYNFVDGTCFGTSGPGDDTTNINPLVEGLSGNGGPTQTSALGPGSPAIGAIPSGTPGFCPRVDQRGLPSTPSGPCDSGAYQSSSPGGIAPSIASGELRQRHGEHIFVLLRPRHGYSSSGDHEPRGLAAGHHLH